MKKEELFLLIAVLGIIIISFMAGRFYEHEKMINEPLVLPEFVIEEPISSQEHPRKEKSRVKIWPFIDIETEK